MNGTSENPQISVIVPFYNEEKNVEEMYRRLKAVLDGLGKTVRADLCRRRKPRPDV